VMSALNYFFSLTKTIDDICSLPLRAARGPRRRAEGEARPRPGFSFREKGDSWRWESGKPAFGFPLFHPPASAGAVEMWESRVLCEISKERWEEGKSCLWISPLSTVPPFPQLVFSFC